MKDHKNKSKKSSSMSKPKLISIIARPLLLILQEEFWAGLMKAYFIYFHPSCTLFSLSSFNPKIASESLLSAIYFAGFIVQPKFPDEVITYMHAYAINNIKKTLFRVNIRSAQALGIYSYAYYINGNYPLHRVCMSHFGRMCYALGININQNNLPKSDQVNIRLVNNNIKLYYDWAKLGPSLRDVASEDDEIDLDVYEPKYQFPDPGLNLCNSEYERNLYSVFCSEFAKLMSLSIIINSKFCKPGSSRLINEINDLNEKTNKVYNEAKLTLQSVINLAPEYKIQTSVYLEMIKAPFIVSILCIYSKMLETSGYNDLGLVKILLDKGIELWKLISSNSTFTDIWSWGPYIVAFHLIQVYPYCSKKQKQTVLFILKSIINMYYKESYNFNSMNFLILQTQFDLINLD
jgi:hypothetical protein